MKSNNKRKSGLLYQKVVKKAPIYENRMRIIEPPKRMYDPTMNLIPVFKPGPEKPLFIPEYKEQEYDPNTGLPVKPAESREGLIRQSIRQELPKFEMPEFKPLRGKAKRQFKRENIQRVADKYGITPGQARRGLRKMRRAGEDYIPEEYLSSLKMVKRNSAVPFKLPHQSNSALPNIELSQAVKDSLHNQANLYGKPFFSPKHGVNVDPEDGVLSNRPVLSEDKIYEGSGGYTLEELENLYPKSEGRQLTYTKIDKPYSNAAPKQLVSSSGGGEIKEIDNDSLASDRYYEKLFNQYMTADKDPRFGPATEQDRWREFLMENYSTRYNPAKGRGEMIEASNPEPGQDVFPSEADVEAVDAKFRIPQRFSWEAYNEKFPR